MRTRRDGQHSVTEPGVTPVAAGVQGCHSVTVRPSWAIAIAPWSLGLGALATGRVETGMDD